MKYPLLKLFIGAFLLFFFLISFSYSNAQHRFLAGTVLFKSGDTLKGYISEIPGRINPRTIQFKKTFTGEITTYRPSDLQWFRYTAGEWYFSFIGPLETSSLHTNELTYDSMTHTVIDTLFIQAIMLSRASLFYARDENDRVHLLMKKLGGEVTELAYKKYYVDEIVLVDYRNKITRRAIYDNQLYKGQLMQAFRDCPYLAAGITQKPLPYAKNEIQALFERYNKCKGAKIIYTAPKDNGKVVFTLNAGLNFTKLKFESMSYPPWNDYHFNPSVGYAFGLGADFLLPRTRGKWGFFNEVSLMSFHTDGDHGNQENVLKLDFLFLKTATMMRYYLTDKKKDFRPYFAFGITNNIALQYSTVDYGDDPSGEPILEFVRTYEQGLLFGYGMYYKRWNCDFRYEFSNGISGYTSLKSPMHTGFILVGYKLFEL